jgi:hypothetical protein
MTTTVTPPAVIDKTNLYAPYKLKSLGNYPLGDYIIRVPDNLFYSGTVTAVKTTNTSVTLEYPKLYGKYTPKANDDYMDVNCYSFANKKYPKSRNFGGFAPFEKYYDPLIYDYNVFGWMNEISFIQHHITQSIYFQGKVSNSYIYGYSMVYLPELPFNNEHAIPDPTGLGLIPYNQRTSLEGKYFVFVKKMISNDQISYEFFPPLPNNKNVEIWIDLIDGSTQKPINGVNRGSGVKVNILYDGFFWTDGGLDSGIVLPAIKNKRSTHQPALLTLPDGSDYGAFRFYSGKNRKKDFDLYRTLNVPESGTVINNAIPCNFSSY